MPKPIQKNQENSHSQCHYACVRHRNVNANSQRSKTRCHRTEQLQDGDGGSYVKNAFTIVRTDKKEKTTYLVATREEKDQWVNSINECIINIPNLSKDRRDTKEIREAAFAGEWASSMES